MADDEGGTPAEPRRTGSATPNRGKPREVPIIEEIPLPGEDAGSDPIGMREGPGFEPSPNPESGSDAAPMPGSTSFPEPEAAPANPSRPAAKQRSRLPALLALLAGLVILLLGGVLYTLYNPPVEASSGTVADLDGLKQRMAALESRPTANPADLASLGDRITALEGAVGTLKDEVGALNGQLDALGKPAAGSPADAPAAQAATPAPSLDLTPLQDRLAALEGSVKDLQAKASAPPPAPDPAPMAALTEEVATLKSTVAGIPRVDLAPVKTEIADLDKRVAPLESALAAPKSTHQVTEARQEGSAAETRAAPVAVTGNAVLRAIDAGKPFTAEMAAFKTLGVDDAKLTPLAPFAAGGAPTAAELLSGFEGLRDKVAGAARPATGNVLDRFLADAQGLVKVRPVGASAGDEPGAIASRIEADLRASDLPAALKEWNALPADAQAASQAWADRLKARIGADDAARAIVADAIAAIGSAQ